MIKRVSHGQWTDQEGLSLPSFRLTRPFLLNGGTAKGATGYGQALNRLGGVRQLERPTLCC